MMLKFNVVPSEKANAFLEIEKSAKMTYAGSFRSFYIAGANGAVGEEYVIDTIYDDKLRAAGIEFDD
jgi:hypothetical protein